MSLTAVLDDMQIQSVSTVEVCGKSFVQLDNIFVHMVMLALSQIFSVF